MWYLNAHTLSLFHIIILFVLVWLVHIICEHRLSSVFSGVAHWKIGTGKPNGLAICACETKAEPSFSSRASIPSLPLLSLIPNSSELASRLPRIQPGYPVVDLSKLYGGDTLSHKTRLSTYTWVKWFVDLSVIFVLHYELSRKMDIECNFHLLLTIVKFRK